MTYMLDTNICIYAIKEQPREVICRLLAEDASEICISSLTFAELMHGVWKSAKIDQNRAALTLFLSAIRIMDFDARAAEEYGKIRADLEKRGTPIGPLDTLIAAHAKSLGLILVTNNEREFRRVDGLCIENWALPE